MLSISCRMVPGTSSIQPDLRHLRPLDEYVGVFYENPQRLDSSRSHGDEHAIADQTPVSQDDRHPPTLVLVQRGQLPGHAAAVISS
jgi:hypothetical protein